MFPFAALLGGFVSGVAGFAMGFVVSGIWLHVITPLQTAASRLACGGERWHMIELNYPASDKRAMDQTVAFISHHLDRYRNICPNR